MFTTRVSRIGLLVCAAGCLLGSKGAWAADDAKGKWVSISDGVVAQITASGKKIGWPGLTGGVGIDRTNGDVYMVVCDNGLWKSTDQGRNFVRVDGGSVTGRCETGFGLDLDPAGKRLACFTVYGNSALSLDAGQNWQRSATGHLDCVAVDWADTSLLSIRHESGGVAIFSPDGGKTWQTLGKGFTGLGIFDKQTFVAFKDAGITRSTDAGKTWTDASNLKPTGKAMRVFQGVGYWIGQQGLLVSRDRGASWTKLGSPVQGALGPYFGSDERHLAVVGKQGVLETTDAGETWKLATPLPAEIVGDHQFGDNMSQFGWDPIHDIFYVGRMGKPTFKYQR